MSDNSLPSPNDGGDTLSFLEKMADIKNLILASSLVLYLDIWLIYFDVDPMSIKVTGLGRTFDALPVITIVIFLLSYALLMTVFFPAVRFTYKEIRIAIPWGLSIPNSKNIDNVRLSNSAMALLWFSTCDIFIGILPKGQYRGLAHYFYNVLSAGGYQGFVFSISIAVLLSMCFLLAIRLD